MSAHQLDDFPPHWEPPLSSYKNRGPGLAQVLKVMDEHPPAPWVKEFYLSKVGNQHE